MFGDFYKCCSSSFCCVPVVRSEFEKRVVASGDNNYRIVPSDISLKGKGKYLHNE